MKVLDFKDDIKSSVVVFLVALPLCLGISLASNAPLASGLIAGIIGGIVVGALSGSQVSVSGPAAGLTVIVINGIAELGGFHAFGMAVLTAGLFQVLFGLLRGGIIGDYFPTAVIKGMLGAIGLILIIKQMPNAFSKEVMGVNIISLVSLGIILLWDKVPTKIIPGPLVAVIVSVILNQIFHLVEGEHLVNLPSAIFSDFKMLSLGGFNLTVLKIGFTIAVVASLETLLCIDASDKLDPEKRTTNKNRELVAQGVGTSLSGLAGGLPITAVIVRSSTNINSGAKTKMSAIFHGFWILLCVLFIPGLLNLIPLATLACVLLTVGYKLIKPSYFLHQYKRGWDQLVIFSTTIVAILLTDLLIGIFIGLFVAIIFEIRKPALSCMEIEDDGGKVHVKFVKNVSFLHKAKIHKILSDISHDRHVHFYGLKSFRVHVDIRDMISDYKDEARKNGRKISFD